MIGEEWRDICYVDVRSGEKIDYIGYYQISNMGRVKSLIRIDGNNHRQGGKILKPKIHKQSGGYRYICLSKNNSKRTFKIHRLVAEMFISNPNKKEYVDHIIPISNGGGDTVNNLRWCTAKENNANELTKKNHFTPNNKGENNPMYGKLGSKNPNSKQVAQYDKQTLELIKIWDSMHDVQRELGIDHRHISSCCRGKQKSAGGFIWRYYVEGD